MADYYIDEGNSYIRLKQEFEKYGKLIIAVDFDDTIINFNSKSINWQLVSLLKRWKPYAEIIIWSCRKEDSYSYIKDVCAEARLEFDKINNPSDLVNFETRKIYANAVLDDRAGLRQVYNDLYKLIGYIEAGEVKYNGN